MKIWAAVLFLLLSLSPTSARNYYVDSESGSDSNSGGGVLDAWQTMKKLTGYGWQPGFQPGDTIYLNGTFTDYLWIQLDLSHGSPGSPLRFTSTDPSNRAIIKPAKQHGINVYSWLVAAGGDIEIDNLVVIGDGHLDEKNGQTTNGIFIYHDAPGDISNFYIHDVEVSGFSDAGIFSYRYNESNHTGVIRNITVENSVVHHNPGYPQWPHPSGNGVVLSGLVGGLIQGVEAHHNGELNESPGGGPVGIWTYDADSVLIRNCSSHDNLSKNNDGGGYDFDGGTTNSLIVDCTSYNNWGPGYEACSYTYGVMNNGGHTQNNTVKDSTSSGDGYGKKFASVGVFPYQVPISEFHVVNVTGEGLKGEPQAHAHTHTRTKRSPQSPLRQQTTPSFLYLSTQPKTVDVTNTTNCTTWGQTYTIHNGVWMEPGNATGSIFLNADVHASSITCNGATVVLNLACDSTLSPECTQS